MECEKRQEILLGAGMEVNIEVGRKKTENKWQPVIFVKEKEYKYRSVGGHDDWPWNGNTYWQVDTKDDAAGTNDGKLEGRHNNIVMKEAAIIEGKNGFSSGSLQRFQVLQILQVSCPMLTGTVTCTCPAFRKNRITS